MSISFDKLDFTKGFLSFKLIIFFISSLNFFAFSPIITNWLIEGYSAKLIVSVFLSKVTSTFSKKPVP